MSRPSAAGAARGRAFGRVASPPAERPSRTLLDVRALPRRPTRLPERPGRSSDVSVSRSLGLASLARSGRTTRSSAPRRPSSRSVSWKYTWTTAGSDHGLASARARSPSECVVGIAASTRPDGSRTRAGATSEAHASPGAEVRRARSRAACSRRTRARRRPRRPPRPCTSRRRRRASARARARAGAAPSSSTRSPVAVPCRAARDPAPSSACGARAGRERRRRARARATRPRPRPRPHRPAA